MNDNIKNVLLTSVISGLTYIGMDFLKSKPEIFKKVKSIVLDDTKKKNKDKKRR